MSVTDVAPDVCQDSIDDPPWVIAAGDAVMVAPGSGLPDDPEDIGAMAVVVWGAADRVPPPPVEVPGPALEVVDVLVLDWPDELDVGAAGGSAVAAEVAGPVGVLDAVNAEGTVTVVETTVLPAELVATSV